MEGAARYRLYPGHGRATGARYETGPHYSESRAAYSFRDGRTRLYRE